MSVRASLGSGHRRQGAILEPACRAGCRGSCGRAPRRRAALSAGSGRRESGRSGGPGALGLGRVLKDRPAERQRLWLLSLCWEVRKNDSRRDAGSVIRSKGENTNAFAHTQR